MYTVHTTCQNTVLSITHRMKVGPTLALKELGLKTNNVIIRTKGQMCTYFLRPQLLYSKQPLIRSTEKLNIQYVLSW